MHRLFCFAAAGQNNAAALAAGADIMRKHRVRHIHVRRGRGNIILRSYGMRLFISACTGEIKAVNRMLCHAHGVGIVHSSEASRKSIDARRLQLTEVKHEACSNVGGVAYELYLGKR